MPLFDYRCPAQHTIEHYYPTGSMAPDVLACSQCARQAVRLFPLVNCLNYFSEANGRVIANLDTGTVIHSHKQHQDLMKAKGVEPATQWGTSAMKRTDGLTPGNIYAARSRMHEG